MHKETIILKAYIAIFLFLALSLKPAYYFGQVVYYELNIDYIIETYCVNKDKQQLQCNGKCHLAKQLHIQNDENSTKGNVNTTAVLECFYPIFNNFQEYKSSVKTMDFFPKRNHINHYANTYSFLRDVSLFRPPIS